MKSDKTNSNREHKADTRPANYATHDDKPTTWEPASKRRESTLQPLNQEASRAHGGCETPIRSCRSMFHSPENACGC
jgi:hypothetical protein